MGAPTSLRFEILIYIYARDSIGYPAGHEVSFWSKIIFCVRHFVRDPSVVVPDTKCHSRASAKNLGTTSLKDDAKDYCDRISAGFPPE